MARLTRARLWQRVGHRCADTADFLLWLPGTRLPRRWLMAAAIRAHVNHIQHIKKAAQ